jgi:hypothetical protein
MKLLKQIMLWIKRARTLLLVIFGITKTNENAKHRALENTFSEIRLNAVALEAKGHADFKAVRWFSISQSSMFYRVYVAQWWQKIFTFFDYCKFRFFRAFLSVDPTDPELIRLVDQTLLNLQFGPMRPPVTEISFVRARILKLQLTNWEVYTAFNSKACVQTTTGITIKPQPKWLNPLNVFPQSFLLACAYIPCSITFLGLLLASGDSMNAFTSIAFSVFIFTAPASVIFFRLGSAWETGERVLSQIYGSKHHQVHKNDIF